MRQQYPHQKESLLAPSCLSCASTATDMCLSGLMSLPGKTALVTGGNSGLGFSICLALAKKNAHVILTARDAKMGKE